MLSKHLFILLSAVVSLALLPDYASADCRGFGAASRSADCATQKHEPKSPKHAVLKPLRAHRLMDSAHADHTGSLHGKIPHSSLNRPRIVATPHGKVVVQPRFVSVRRGGGVHETWGCGPLSGSPFQTCGVVRAFCAEVGGNYEPHEPPTPSPGGSGEPSGSCDVPGPPPPEPPGGYPPQG